MNGLEKITERILSDAKAYAEAAEADAARAVKAVEAETDEKLQAIREASRQKTEKETEAARLRTLSTVEVLERDALLKAKSDLLDRVYRQTEETLRTLSPEEYVRLLGDLLVRTVAECIQNEEEWKEYYATGELTPVESFELILSEADKARIGDRLAKTIEERLGQCDKPVRISDETAPLEGGFILRSGDVERNCSLSLLVQRLREKTEGQIYQTLFPDEGTKK